MLSTTVKVKARTDRKKGKEGGDTEMVETESVANKSPDVKPITTTGTDSGDKMTVDQEAKKEEDKKAEEIEPEFGEVTNPSRVLKA